MTDESVVVGRAHRSLGGGSFKRVDVGGVAMKLVGLSTHGGVVEPMFLVEDWETFERVPVVERSGRAGVWSTEHGALMRAVEHVYEHSPVCSAAHKVAAAWLVSTDWGRRP